MMHAFYKWDRWRGQEIVGSGMIALCLYMPEERGYLIPDNIVTSNEHETTCSRCLVLTRG